ncbi:DNA-binding transcriptional regulator, PadR family [Nonomuraea solani]|uniref:DNA-binding transcriptional regulator, PadR family n=1 Tax=Nonomuraea solani TaxID=1144553 RepID=A0A1H6DF32_9ACTN|nr:PadR family transcriptional regulator [Nonomuraea solani]SEG83672.1 DNA-binding transcriptional regulator, PadR family [Nonomuraea solani]
MSATRLLVLGVVRLLGEAHGYLVGAELESWEAGRWAGLRSGSIYHALRQLAKDGLLDVTEVHEWPGRVDYAINGEGEAEFLRLLRNALSVPDRRPEVFGAAVVLLPALPKEETIALLKERLGALEGEEARIAAAMGEATREAARPGSLVRLFDLRAQQVAGDAAWTRGLIARLERGEEPA